jgi:hypothetical protein
MAFIYMSLETQGWAKALMKSVKTSSSILKLLFLKKKHNLCNLLYSMQKYNIVAA